MLRAIVTGGTRGIGLGISRRLVQSGFHVIAIARKESEEFLAAKREVAEGSPNPGEGSQSQSLGSQAAGSQAAGHQAVRSHGALDFVAYDLADLEGLPQLVKRVRKDFGPIYGLVNNAGMSIDGALAFLKTQQIEEVVRLNTVSPMVLTKHVVRAMMADGGGRIVNISSVAASSGYAGLSVYAATKASLVGFTRSLAREVGRMAVNVNAVAPGFVETEMTQGLTEEQREQIVRRSALKRLTEVEDVANAVDFLLSDRANSITGTVLTVDAGNTA